MLFDVGLMGKAVKSSFAILQCAGMFEQRAELSIYASLVMTLFVTFFAWGLKPFDIFFFNIYG